MTEHLRLAGGTIAYDVAGPADGRLVVLAHGMGDTRAAFRFVVPVLVAAGYRVATADLRGHGESSVPWSSYGCRVTGEDLLALARHLGGAATLVGHSSSASSVIWAAAEDPEAVQAIVVASPFLHQPELTPLLRAAQWLVVRSPSLWLAYYTSLYKAGKPADFPAYRKALKATLRGKGRMAATAGLIETHADCNARIPELRVPVLLTMGTADPDFKDAAAEAALDERELAEHTPVRMQLVEGAGHYPHAEVPEAYARLLVEFLGAAARA
jgi:pimeloyl-ACP methyl ester carboxylesterase